MTTGRINQVDFILAAKPAPLDYQRIGTKPTLLSARRNVTSRVNVFPRARVLASLNFLLS